MAPDKIYFEIDEKGRAHTYLGLQPDYAEEYIRKEVLLEWAENEKKWREEAFNGENYFASAQTVLSALIDKLNSM